MVLSLSIQKVKLIDIWQMPQNIEIRHPPATQEVDGFFVNTMRPLVWTLGIDSQHTTGFSLLSKQTACLRLIKVEELFQAIQLPLLIAGKCTHI